MPQPLQLTSNAARQIQQGLRQANKQNRGEANLVNVGIPSEKTVWAHILGAVVHTSAGVGAAQHSWEEFGYSDTSKTYSLKTNGLSGTDTVNYAIVAGRPAYVLPTGTMIKLTRRTCKTSTGNMPFWEAELPAISIAYVGTSDGGAAFSPSWTYPVYADQALTYKIADAVAVSAMAPSRFIGAKVPAPAASGTICYLRYNATASTYVIDAVGETANRHICNGSTL